MGLVEFACGGEAVQIQGHVYEETYDRTLLCRCFLGCHWSVP